MSELEYILSRLNTLESKYGYMKLQWKIVTGEGYIAIVSRPLSSEERVTIEIDSQDGLSTCSSYSTVVIFDNQICIECTHDDTVIIPVSIVQDVILKYIPPIRFTQMIIGDTLFL